MKLLQTVVLLISVAFAGTASATFKHHNNGFNNKGPQMFSPATKSFKFKMPTLKKAPMSFKKSLVKIKRPTIKKAPKFGKIKSLIKMKLSGLSKHKFNFKKRYKKGRYNKPSEVPVPAAAFLLAPALLGFLGLRRKAKAA